MTFSLPITTLISLSTWRHHPALFWCHFQNKILRYWYCSSCYGANSFIFLLIDYLFVFLDLPLCASNAGDGGRGPDIMIAGGISTLLSLSLGAVDRVQYPGDPKNNSGRPRQVDRRDMLLSGRTLWNEWLDGFLKNERETWLISDTGLKVATATPPSDWLLGLAVFI